MDKQLVVVDEGSAQIKVIWNEDGQMKHHVIPSRVISGAKLNDDCQFMPSAYNVEGLEYTWHPEMGTPEPTTSIKYQTSKYNRALIHEALRQAGFGGKTVDVVTTLPVGQFFKTKPVNTALIEKKKENVTGEIQSPGNYELATIDECFVSPEAIPAWNDIRMNDDGSVKKEFKGIRRVLLVDIGGYTTDLTILTPTGLEEFKSIPKAGVFHLRENLKERLHTDPEINVGSFSEGQIDRVLATKTFLDVDVSGHVENAKQFLVSEIVGKMEALEDEPEKLDYIIYAGGGSALIGELMSKEYGGRPLFPEEPDLAIARGIYKSNMKQKRKTQTKAKAGATEE